MVISTSPSLPPSLTPDRPSRQTSVKLYTRMDDTKDEMNWVISDKSFHMKAGGELIDLLIKTRRRRGEIFV